MMIKFRLAIAMSMAFLIVTPLVHAQTNIRVLNESLEPLVGAHVQAIDEATLYVTDSLGAITLEITSSKTFLIQHIGFQDQSIVLGPGESKVVVMVQRTDQLNAVEVEGFLSDTQLNKQAGAISLIRPAQFNRFNQISLVNGINTVPGIRFEERASGSYRVSIRGSSIRSPFGVRNVKVYWNGIPFTEPGGNTFINLLDLVNVGNVEVIKGPAGSLYGAGTGGVMKINSTNLGQFNNGYLLKSTFGSYGLRKLSSQFNMLDDKRSLTLKFASQVSDGYRDHNALDRKSFEMDFVSFTSAKSTFTANILYSDLFYEIPGGLNPDQLEVNRKQARPGSESQNSSVSNELFLLKLGQEYKISDRVSNETHVYGSFNQFTNPFILDFKRDNQQVFGGRSIFQLDLSDHTLNVGVEHQNSFFDGKNFGNIGGESDTIRFADEVKISSTNLFSQLDIQLGLGLNVSAGISINSLSYNINRLIDAFDGMPEEFEKDFETVFAPRIAISKEFSKEFSAHLSISRGFSPPTTTEIRTNEGTISLDLEPEKGTNYELNFRGATSSGKLSFDMALFYFRLSETIVSNPNEQGVVLFQNAGRTDQKGAELQINATLLERSSGFTRNINSSLSYTYHNFSFRDYVKRGNDFSGNALPGTAPSTLNWTLDVEFMNSMNLNFTYHYVDPIPLNDANTFSSQAYSLLNLRLAYQLPLSNSLLEFFTGIDNMTNASYSLGNDLNAFGRRYFQPAPEVNYYFGISLRLNNK